MYIYRLIDKWNIKIFKWMGFKIYRIWIVLRVRKEFKWNCLFILEGIFRMVVFIYCYYYCFFFCCYVLCSVGVVFGLICVIYLDLMLFIEWGEIMNLKKNKNGFLG